MGWVFSKGELLNIMNAYSDDRFDPEYDERKGYRTNNILLSPIKDDEGNIIGIFLY